MSVVRDATVFDVLIVGAGAAGCVLAGRLSERKELRVLLVEAGPDVPVGDEHPDIRDPYPVALANPSFSWPHLTAAFGVDPGGGQARAERRFLQGFGIGGGSNIQGMIAFRGQPADYDEWADSGAPGWGWDDVLPYFNKLERDLDFPGPLHGDRGPIPVRRILPADWAPFSAAMGAAFMRRGYPLIADYNADFGEGVSPVPMANLPQQRVSASMGYLDHSVRKRPNLNILPDTFVERIVVRQGRACGVAARLLDGTRCEYRARQTILSCGALHSPAVLLRSGVGSDTALRALGINVVRNLPGVGQHLQNHPKIELAVHLPSTSVQSSAQRGFGQNCLRYSSRLPGCVERDMGIVVINRASWHALGHRMGALGIAVYRPYSQGTVDLVSADPATPPRVRFNHLSDQRDLHRLVSGLRFALELLSDPAVASVRNEVFFPDGRIVARLSRRTRRNRLVASALAAMLDLPLLRRAVLRPALSIKALVHDEPALQDLVRRHASLSHHVCGTCKMGRASDSGAVVDEACRVRGIEGLRVVDASVFPFIVRGNPHLPVLMIAEKMADMMKAE
jgi:5-(hydroxymethyl)furfural/furfural oxidase